jgi:hypothetical protein
LMVSFTAGRKRAQRTLGACAKSKSDRRVIAPGGTSSMSDKVVLPRLDLPGQKTHWAIVAVVGGSVLVLLMAAIFLVVVHKQQAAQEAAARAVEDRAKGAAAQIEKMKLEAAAAERVKAAAAAAEKAKSAGSVAAGDAANKAGAAGSSVGEGDSGKAGQKRKGHKSGRRAGRNIPKLGGGEPSESTKKSDASVDALLRGLK